MNPLRAETIDVTPCGSMVLPSWPDPRPGTAVLWIGRTIPAHDLAAGLLTEVRLLGWDQALLVDQEFNVFQCRDRCRVSLRPPFWVIRDHRVFYGLQLSPRAYDALRVVKIDQGIEIEAYTNPAAELLARVSHAPWIAPVVERESVVRLINGKRA